MSTRGCHDEFCGAWIKGYLLFCCPSGSSYSAGGVGSLVSQPPSSPFSPGQALLADPGGCRPGAEPGGSLPVPAAPSPAQRADQQVGGSGVSRGPGQLLLGLHAPLVGLVQPLQGSSRVLKQLCAHRMGSLEAMARGRGQLAALMGSGPCSPPTGAVPPAPSPQPRAVTPAEASEGEQRPCVCWRPTSTAWQQEGVHTSPRDGDISNGDRACQGGREGWEAYFGRFPP